MTNTATQPESEPEDDCPDTHDEYRVGQMRCPVCKACLPIYDEYTDGFIAYCLDCDEVVRP